MSGAGASHMGGMDAMSIDMDPTGNTATSLGTRQSCGEVSPGGTLTFDVTAAGIPPYDGAISGGMIGWFFSIRYDEAALTLESHDIRFLISVNPPGALPYNASQFLPDIDLDNKWNASAADLQSPPSIPESGSGVLTRVTISAGNSASVGYYSLFLTDAGHLDYYNDVGLADQVNGASLAVGVSCQNLPAITPTPLPTGGSASTPPPPPNPVPTPGPGIGPMQRMSIDMNIASNTASSLGPLDTCAEAEPGDLLSFDVTARAIPPYNQNGTVENTTDDFGGIIGFQVNLLYPEAYISVQSQDVDLILGVTPGSAPFDDSQAIPDTDGSWVSAAGDSTSPAFTAPESGNGVLTRISVLIGATTPLGEYTLSLGSSTGHINARNDQYGPDATDSAFIAVGVPCDVDHDGVADAQDGCVNYPGPSFNAGCPPAGAPAVGGVAGLLEGPSPDLAGQRHRLNSLLFASVILLMGLFGAVAGGTCLSGRARRGS